MKRILTDLQLRNARELYASGQYTKTELAREYGVSITTMCLWLSDGKSIRKSLNKKKRKARTHCGDCGVAYSKHPRCIRCEKLVCEGTLMCEWCISDIDRLTKKKHESKKG